MNNLIKYGFLLLVVCFYSCDSNKERRENFSEKRIVTDSDGNEWMVKHHIGDNYFLEPITKK